MVEEIGKMTVCEKVVDSLRHTHVHVYLMRLVVIVNRDRNPVAEDREERTDRNRDRAHRPHVNEHRHSEGGGDLRGKRPTEPRNEAQRQQERGRTDLEATDPCG
jgi:hypothetical protein